MMNFSPERMVRIIVQLGILQAPLMRLNLEEIVMYGKNWAENMHV